MFPWQVLLVFRCIFSHACVLFSFIIWSQCYCCWNCISNFFVGLWYNLTYVCDKFCWCFVEIATCVCNKFSSMILCCLHVVDFSTWCTLGKLGQSLKHFMLQLHKSLFTVSWLLSMSCICFNPCLIASLHINVTFHLMNAICFTWFSYLSCDLLPLYLLLSMLSILQNFAELIW